MERRLEREVEVGERPDRGEPGQLQGGFDAASLAAVFYTLVESAKINGVDPKTYIATVLDRPAKGHMANHLAELLPWAINTPEISRTEQAA